MVDRAVRTAVLLLVVAGWLALAGASGALLGHDGSLYAVAGLLLFLLAIALVLLVCAACGDDLGGLVLIVAMFAGFFVMAAVPPAVRLHYGRTVEAMVTATACRPDGDSGCTDEERLSDVATEHDLGWLPCRG